MWQRTVAHRLANFWAGHLAQQDGQGRADPSKLLQFILSILTPTKNTELSRGENESVCLLGIDVNIKFSHSISVRQSGTQTGTHCHSRLLCNTSSLSRLSMSDEGHNDDPLLERLERHWGSPAFTTAVSAFMGEPRVTIYYLFIVYFLYMQLIIFQSMSDCYCSSRECEGPRNQAGIRGADPACVLPS